MKQAGGGRKTLLPLKDSEVGVYIKYLNKVDILCISNIFYILVLFTFYTSKEVTCQVFGALTLGLCWKINYKCFKSLSRPAVNSP